MKSIGLISAVEGIVNPAASVNKSRSCSGVGRAFNDIAGQIPFWYPGPPRVLRACSPYLTSSCANASIVVGP